MTCLQANGCRTGLYMAVLRVHDDWIVVDAQGAGIFSRKTQCVKTGYFRYELPFVVGAKVIGVDKLWIGRAHLPHEIYFRVYAFNCRSFLAIVEILRQ